MSIDVYTPCPCGSGKKLKFCCAPIVEEMGRVARHQAAEQPRNALQILEKLEKSHPDNPWVGTTHAEILLGQNDARGAKEILERLLRVHPDHAPAFATFAIASIVEDGLDAAKPAIYRAFQKCVTRFPQSVGFLALTVASAMSASNRFVAARQCLTLAMRFLDAKSREEVFMMLLRLDGNAEIPYPLRSVHNLVACVGEAEKTTEAAKANTLASIGCWGPAARVFARIAEHDPQNAAAWNNVGLCRAWDGDETGAAEALHRAASASEDFESAVESETLAQLFDLKTTGDRVAESETTYPIRSASRMLALLDGNERIVRIPSETRSDDDDDAMVAGEFSVHDKPAPAEIDWELLTADEIPGQAAFLTVYDAVPEQDVAAKVVLRGYAGDAFDSACELFKSVANDEIAGPASTVDVSAESETMPREHLPYFHFWSFPPKVPASVRRTIVRERQLRDVRDVWPHAPQAALDGKSPLAVKTDPQYRVRLAAAVYVFDALAQRIGAPFDPEAALRMLGIEPLKPIEPSSQVVLSAFSPMQLHRLPVAKLSDAELVYAQRRAMLIGHRRFVEEVLTEVLARPQCAEQVDLDHVYRTLINLVREAGRSDEALRLLQQAQEQAATQPEPFVPVLSWAFQEFWLRFENPDDPKLPGLFRHLAEFYAPKVPQIASAVEAIRQQFGGKYAWLRATESVVEAGAMPDAGPGGIWTPASESAPPATRGKLWIPGQE